MILQSLAGLPVFLLYFCTMIVAVVAYSAGAVARRPNLSNPHR
jgi:hypothetical protein